MNENPKSSGINDEDKALRICVDLCEFVVNNIYVNPVSLVQEAFFLVQIRILDSESMQ